MFLSWCLVYLVITVVYCLSASLIVWFSVWYLLFFKGYGLVMDQCWEFCWLSFMRVISGNLALVGMPGSICFLRSGSLQIEFLSSGMINVEM